MAIRSTARPGVATVDSPSSVGSARGLASGAMMANTRSWTLSSDVHEIAPVVRDIVAMCREAGFSDRHCGLNVPVATTEALTNAMLAGNRGEQQLAVAVAVEVSVTCLVVEVADQGCGFDLAACEHSPDDADWFEREDGRGIFLMRALMDRVENTCMDGGSGHRLRLVLYRT